MKKWIYVLGVISLLYSSYGFSQIVITKDELPSKLGTTLTSMHDTTEHAEVDVGLPGENQTWTFIQPINGIEITTEVVDLNSTPFKNDFPASNWVIKYSDGLLDIIYSDVFPQIKGDVYFYQEIGENNIKILGTGFVSSYITGSALFNPPNVILELVPTQYQDTWITSSNFTISKDTTILGVPGTYALTVHDTAYSVIDGWGKVVIPLGTFDCLRMKSYVFMDEKVTFNGLPITTKKTRIINYNWLGEDLGLIVRVASHTGEQNDNFTDGRLFTRLERIGALPVEVSVLDYELVGNLVKLHWKTESEDNNWGFEIKRRKAGEDFTKIGFVEGAGTSNEPKDYFFSDEQLEPGNYQYRVKQIDFDGSFTLSKIIDVKAPLPDVISLDQNYPNPFNPETMISYELADEGFVSLDVYNILGEKVRSLENTFKSAGRHSILWNGKNDDGVIMPAGVYIYQLNFNDNPREGNGKKFVRRKKLVLAK